MGTYKAKCDICFEETEAPNYGDWDCPHCHQPYTYDEGHQIRLTDAQWATLRNPPRWIPVGERLPAALEIVLTAGPCGLVIGYVCLKERWHSEHCDNENGEPYLGDDGTPTHWMPLPEPPEVT